MRTLQLSQLQRAVHPCHLQHIADAMSHYRHGIGHSHGNNVGQVILALGIVVIELGEPDLQMLGRHGHDAAVNLGNGTLGIVRVLLLNNALHCASLVAHNAAIACRVRHAHRQQRQLVAARCIHQALQCGGLRQGHISRKHNHQAVIGQLGNCLLHCMAGTQLGLLARKQQVKTGFSALCTCEGCFHFCSTMTRNHHGRARL